jgi:hypothetical protein
VSLNEKNAPMRYDIVEDLSTRTLVNSYGDLGSFLTLLFRHKYDAGWIVSKSLGSTQVFQTFDEKYCLSGS